MNFYYRTKGKKNCITDYYHINFSYHMHMVALKVKVVSYMYNLYESIYILKLNKNAKFL